MSRRRAAALLAACLIAVFVAPQIMWDAYWWSQVSPQLDPLPALAESPGYTVDPIKVGNLILNASANFTGGIPHRGPESFGFTLIVNVSNIGESDIIDFQVVKATAFRQDLTPVYSFSITSSGNATITSNAFQLLTYEGDWYVPRGTVSFGMFFLRVLVTFDASTEGIITTPLSLGIFWIE